MPAVLTLDIATTPVRIRVNKGEDFTLTIPVYDSTVPTPILVSLVGWTAVAQVRGQGSLSPLLFEWSAAAANIATTAAGVVLTFNGAVTNLWTWSDGLFEVDVTSPAGKRGIVAAGPFAAAARLVAP